MSDMAALNARSREVRGARKALRARIARQHVEGPYIVAELIEENDDTARAMRVLDLVRAIWQVSESQAETMVESCDIPITRRVRQLTVRQRLALGERLRTYARGRRLGQHQQRRAA